MEISGYTNNPSPPPLEHPNSARSSTKDTKSEGGSPKKDDKDSDKKKDEESKSPN